MIDTNLLDSADFYEILLKHLARDKKTVARAKALGLAPEDFMSSTDFGVRLYFEIAKCLLDECPPPSAEQLLIQLSFRFKDGRLDPVHLEVTAKLVQWMYSTEITEDHFADSLKYFVKRRREEKVKLELKDDTNELVRRLSKIAVELEDYDSDKAEVINPFKKLILPSINTMVPTGFSKVDAIMGGLGLGEYGLIIGFTGSGKTAVATMMTASSALNGIPVAYIPFEDTLDMVAQRFYSRRYRLDYSELRKGVAISELQQKWGGDEDKQGLELLASNIRIIGLKEHAPCKLTVVKNALDAEYEKTGFKPKVVIIDQMQFLLPSRTINSNNRWESEQVISQDCDQLSHTTIGGEGFALWVTHQAKGKIKLDITREEIQGFKGIDQPTDATLYIGRDGQFSDDFIIASLKSRHSANFRVKYKGNLKHMELIDVEDFVAPPENRIAGHPEQQNAQSKFWK